MIYNNIGMGEEPNPEGQAAFESPFFCVEAGERSLLYAGRSAARILAAVRSRLLACGEGRQRQNTVNGASPSPYGEGMPASPAAVSKRSSPLRGEEIRETAKPIAIKLPLQKES